ncbi:MAG: DUF7451 domain-containing protein [Candidatus Eiseniibacteriota bacterium]
MLPLRHHGVLTLVAAHLAIAAPALAAKSEPLPLTPPGGPPGGVSIDALTNGACQMGVVGPATRVFAYILPPDDAYYTLITPAACPTCPTDGRLLTTAHVLLYFNATCEIPVTVSIVPATDLGDGCLAPDLLAAPLSDPTSYVIGAVTLNQCVDYALPVPPGCCIEGPAFLKIEFDQGSCPNYKPGFCGPAACSDCAQYNTYPGVTGAHGDDLCSMHGMVGIMNVESTCCSPTSTAPGTWGRLKTLYR